MSDVDNSFEVAVGQFRSFLKQNDWSDLILWLSADRLIEGKARDWLFRPDELRDDFWSREFYETARKDGKSLGIEALCKLGDMTVAYVMMKGDSGHINFAVPTPPGKAAVVTSKFIWWFLRIFQRIAFRSQWRYLGITPRSAGQ